MNRQRRYKYSSFIGLLPTSRAGFFLACFFFAMSFLIGGVARLPAGMVLIPIGVLILAEILHETPFIRRRRAMRAVAKQFGLKYAQRDDDIDWQPPWRPLDVKVRRCFNVLRGRFDGVPVVVFDSFIVQRKKGYPSRGGASGFRFFSVVRFQSSDILPPLLIGGKYLTNLPAEAIPGTRYFLFGPTEMRDHVQFLSHDLIELLKANPGLVIESQHGQLTVYCYRWFSMRRQTPANLPAFLEDAIYLQQLLPRCRKQDISGTEITVDSSKWSPNPDYSRVREFLSLQERLRS